MNALGLAMSSPKKANYYSRVEYRAVQKEVEEKLAAGFRIRQIYEELTQAGKITISYTSFCDYVRGQGERQHSRKKQRHAAVKQTIEPARKVNQGAFHHEKMADLDELGPPKKNR